MTAERPTRDRRARVDDGDHARPGGRRDTRWFSCVLRTQPAEVRGPEVDGDPVRRGRRDTGWFGCVLRTQPAEVRVREVDGAVDDVGDPLRLLPDRPGES